MGEGSNAKTGRFERIMMIFLEDAPWYFRLFVLILFLCAGGMIVSVSLPIDPSIQEKLFAYFADGFKVTLGAILGALTGIVGKKKESVGA